MPTEADIMAEKIRSGKKQPSDMIGDSPGRYVQHPLDSVFGAPPQVAGQILKVRQAAAAKERLKGKNKGGQSGESSRETSVENK